MKVTLAFFILLAVAAAAQAQPVSGFYIQGSAGAALPAQQSVNLPASSWTTPSSSTAPSAAVAANAAINAGLGSAQSGSVGWGFGNGVRMEVEGVHSQRSLSTNN
jgi:OOP family OmpA-OmpF porin